MGVIIFIEMKGMNADIYLYISFSCCYQNLCNNIAYRVNVSQSLSAEIAK